MLRATLAGLFAHKLRLALAAIAVVLGVAFVSGVLVLGDTMNKTFDDLFHTVDAGVDVNIRGTSTAQDLNGQALHPPLQATLVGSVQQVDGVKEAFGYLQRLGVVVVGRDGKPINTTGGPSFGLLWNPYDDMTSLHLRSGSAPQGASQVVIDAATARKGNFAVGDTVTVVLPTLGPRQMSVSGVAGFGSSDNLVGATLVAFDTTQGRTLLGAPTEFDGINVRAADGVSQAALAARIARVLPAGVEAITGQALTQEQTDAVRQNLSILTTILLVFAFVSVFVGSFIILNTFSILVAQRQRELALMRALGASRGQVMRSVLLEAVITGVMASALGLVIGVLIAKGLEALLAGIGLDLGSTPLQVGAKPIIVGLFVGIVVTVVASLIPARRATRISPVEALRDSAPAPSAVSPARIASGGALLVGGAVLLLLALLVLSSNQLLLTGAGAMLTFVGVAVLAPIVVPPVVAVLGRPIGALRGVPGRLARENARRNPRRTASTASALMIGVGLVSTFTVVAASFKASVNGVVDRTLTADFVVVPDSNQGLPAVPPAVSTRIRAIPEVAVVSEFSGGTFLHNGQRDQLTAVDPATVDAVAVITARDGQPLSRLTDSQVAISEDAAKSQSLRVGDTLPVQLEKGGVHQQKVATVFARNPLFGDYVLTLAFWQQGSAQVFDFQVAVKGRPGVNQDQLRSRLTTALTGFPALKVQNNAEFKKATGDAIDQLLNLMNVLLAFAIVIALLGVVNTMALSIVERTRELGLVRALGMTRGQTRSMVRWETVIITLFGAFLGLVVGLFFGWALVKAFASGGVDTLDVGVGQQISYLVIAFVAGLVAALFPAFRASRVNMLQAIATE